MERNDQLVCWCGLGVANWEGIYFETKRCPFYYCAPVRRRSCRSIRSLSVSNNPSGKEFWRRVGLSLQRRPNRERRKHACGRIDCCPSVVALRDSRESYEQSHWPFRGSAHQRPRAVREGPCDRPQPRSGASDWRQRRVVGVATCRWLTQLFLCPRIRLGQSRRLAPFLSNRASRAMTGSSGSGHEQTCSCRVRPPLPVSPKFGEASRQSCQTGLS